MTLIIENNDESNNSTKKSSSHTSQVTSHTTTRHKPLKIPADKGYVNPGYRNLSRWNNIGFDPFFPIFPPNMSPSAILCNSTPTCPGLFDSTCAYQQNNLGGWGYGKPTYRTKCGCIKHFYNRNCATTGAEWMTPWCIFGCADCCDIVCP